MQNDEGAHGIIDTVIENRHGGLSSNPELGYLCFTLL